VNHAIESHNDPIILLATHLQESTSKKQVECPLNAHSKYYQKAPMREHITFNKQSLLTSQQPEAVLGQGVSRVRHLAQQAAQRLARGSSSSRQPGQLLHSHQQRQSLQRSLAATAAAAAAAAAAAVTSAALAVL
jgi:hypothetical protein